MVYLGVNFTNILRAAFFVRKCLLKLFSNYSLALKFFGERILAQKAVKKMFGILTTDFG